MNPNLVPPQQSAPQQPVVNQTPPPIVPQKKSQTLLWSVIFLVVILGGAVGYIYIQKITNNSKVVENVSSNNNSTPINNGVVDNTATKEQIIATTSEKVAATTSDWNSFQSAVYKFKISYPKSYGFYTYNTDTKLFVVANSNISLGGSDNPYNTFLVAKPSAIESENVKKEGYPFVSASLYIQISNAPASIGPNGVEPMNLENYERNTKQQYETHNQQAIEQNRSDLVEKVTYNTFVINGQPAFETITDNGDRIAIFGNNKLFLFDIDSTTKSPSDVELFKNIVKTFKFTK